MRSLTICGLFATGIIMVLAGCNSDSNPVSSKPAITLGATVHVSTTPIGTSGGVVSVTGGVLDGFRITVPVNAFPLAKTFDVSYAPVTSHAYGADFNPISPVITIEYGGGRADSNMIVRIPAHVPAGHFAMGFYVDTVTGELEGIPLVAFDSTGVTIVTHHFSKFVVSSIDQTKLLALNVESGFKPGVDDWEFPNWGSALKPGGHCGGQSIAAMWYYVERKVNQHQPSLFGRFAEYSKIWQSNPRGYRLSSMFQLDANWASDFAARENHELYTAPDQLDFLAFAYTINMTHRPQLVTLVTADAKSAHAVIAYKIVGPTMYLADPNLPGDKQRTTTLIDGKFTSYLSGDEADQIDKPYSKILFVGVTSVVDWSHASTLWSAFDDGTIGRDVFPQYTLHIDGEKGPETPRDTMHTTSSKLWFSVSTSGSDVLAATVYRSGLEVPKAADGSYPVYEGRNDFSIYVTRSINGTRMWNDWRSIVIEYTTAPRIDTIIPPTGAPGERVAIQGSNFGNRTKPSRVTFTGKEATIMSWNDSVIEALVPTSISSGEVIVTVGDSASNRKKFSVVSGLLAALHRMTGVSVQFSADNVYSDNIPRSPYFSIPPGDSNVRIVWNGDTTFVINGVYNGPFTNTTTITCTGAVSGDGMTLVAFEARVHIEPAAGHTGRKETIHLSFTGLRENSSSSDSAGTASETYQFYGVQAQFHVAAVEDVLEMENGDVVRYLSTKWESTDTPAQPNVTIGR